MTAHEPPLNGLGHFARPLASALASVGVGVCELDAHGLISWLSPHAANLLGIATGEGVGHALSAFVHAELEGVARTWPNAGHAWLVPVRLVPQGPGLVFVVEDTDRSGLLTQLKLNHAAVEAAANAIVITDHQGVIDYVNPAFTRMTGYAGPEAVGQHVRLLKSGRHDHAFYDVMWATLTSGATWSGTLINRRKDGSHYTEECSITPIEGPDGFTHYVSVKRDVTLQQRFEDLAGRSERMGLIGELVVSVAHDLNNILTPIVAGVSFLQSGRTESAEDTQEAIADIAESTKRAQGMVGQLVDFARGGQGLRAPIKTSGLLKTYVTQLSRALPKNVSTEVKIAEKLPALFADSLQLYQVLQNLCVNAVDAMPDGGSLRVEAKPTQRDGAPWVELAVTDTGSGIAPDVLPHLFEPFFTTKPPGRGTGLGLATVKRVASAHGGTVQVVSEPGRGSTFTVSLPVGLS